MEQWLELATVLLFLTNLVMLGSSELGGCIRVVAIQGILLGIFTLIARQDALTIRLIILGVVSMGLKGFVFPFLLARDIREAKVRREVEPFVGYAASIVVGLIFIVCNSGGALDGLHRAFPRCQPAQSVNSGHRISRV
jgi:hydrogenase-4 component E